MYIEIERQPCTRDPGYGSSCTRYRISIRMTEYYDVMFSAISFIFFRYIVRARATCTLHIWDPLLALYRISGASIYNSDMLWRRERAVGAGWGCRERDARVRCGAGALANSEHTAG